VKQQEAEGFQPQGKAWNPRRQDIAQLLESATPTDIQPIYYGSNHTFLVTLDGGVAGKSLGVYKPARGEYPLYDFPTGTLYRREAAMWVLDILLGWELVPPTVVSAGRYGRGSVQLFIESRSEGEIEVGELQRLVLLDVIANNADRKAEHCLVGRDDSLWGIDHGLTFNAQFKLRTVLWHFAGEPIPDEHCHDLRKLRTVLARCDTPDVRRLSQLISKQEFIALRHRVDAVIREGEFPDPRYKAVPYRW
jgi:hypothetical protein